MCRLDVTPVVVSTEVNQKLNAGSKIERDAPLRVKLGNIVHLGIYGKKRKNQVRVADLHASQILLTLSKNLQSAK